MMNDPKRHIDRLEQQQRRANERLERQRELVNERFDRIRQRMGEQPSDRQEEIIAAALRLLDTEGLEGLSLRKLAATLNMQAPAIYWHFKSKEDLIDYMAEAILQAEFADFAPRADDEPWQSWLLNAAGRLRRAMLSHRQGGRVVAGAHLYPAITLATYSETVMQSLRSVGFSLNQARLASMTLTHFIFGRVIEEQSGPTAEQVQEFTSPEAVAKFHDRFPTMAAAIRLTDFTQEAADTDFNASLQLIISGLEVQKNQGD